MGAYEEDDNRCDDRREFDQADIEAEIAASRAQPYDGDCVQSLVAVQDDPVKEGSLDLLVPGMSDRGLSRGCCGSGTSGCRGTGLVCRWTTPTARGPPAADRGAWPVAKRLNAAAT